VRLRGGRRLNSPPLVADGYHARTDGLVSLAVVLSAIVVALGAPIADPVIGLAVTLVILRITWQSDRPRRPGRPEGRRLAAGATRVVGHAGLFGVSASGCVLRTPRKNSVGGRSPRRCPSGSRIAHRGAGLAAAAGRFMPVS
jgi:hypothetical protein